MNASANDRLGRRGQNLFRRWCEDDHELRCHPPDPDHMGWDFFVEFPPVPRPKEPLDRHVELTKVLVQVKSTQRRGASVRAKLSALKHLVDSDLPTFIVCLEYAKSQLCRARILHIGESEIFFILKQVRTLEAAGRVDLNRHKISLPLVNAVELQLDGSNLRSALTETIGSETAAYVSKKAAFRESCGYEDDSKSLKFSWTSRSGGEELVDLILGYVPELKLDESIFETKRFGIALDKDVRRYSGGVLKIEPSPARRDMISIRHGNVRSSLDVDIHSPGIPNLPKKYQKFRLKNEFIDIKLHLGEGILNAKFRFHETEKHPISLLARFLKFTFLFSNNGALLSLGEPSLLTVPIKEKTSEFHKLGPLSEFAEFFSLAIHRHFPERTPITSLRDLARSLWKQKGMFSLISSRGTNNLFRIEGIENLDPETTRLVLFFPATLSFDKYQYGALMKLDSSSLTFHENSIVMRDVICQIVDEFFSDDGDDIYQLVLAAGQKIANSSEKHKGHEAFALASLSADGTYDLIGF